MMKLAISGVEAPYLNSSIKGILKDAEVMGVRWIELIYPENVRTEGLEPSLKLIEESSIRVSAISSYSRLIGPWDPEEKQRMLLEALEAAGRLGAPYANTYFGYAEKRDDNALIELYRQRLEPCLEKAAQLGVTIVLENECDVEAVDPEESDVTRCPETMRILMEKVGSEHFGVCFDATNAYIAGYEPYPYGYDLLADYIRYVHVKDGAVHRKELYPDSENILADHGEEYVLVPLGEGAVNTEGLLERLRADGYEGFLALEPHLPARDLRKGFEDALRYLRDGGFGE